MIPYGRHEITKKDIDAVVNVLRSDSITQGPHVPTFEKGISEYSNANYAVAVNSCTSALHIACLALGLGPGDNLWTSPITFVASANCGLYCGATVDFIDIESDSALISVNALRRKLEVAHKLGKLPKIVIPVHFAGQPCDMEEIYKLSQKYGFKIIEDAAHAIGARYKNEPVGNCRYSDITVFSYHPVKMITTGEGGSAMTNDQVLYKRMVLLRSHGITRDQSNMAKKSKGAWYYEQIDLGFNYRMTDIQAALGSSQLTRLNAYVTKRNEIANWYNNELYKLNMFEPLTQKEYGISSYHLYVIRVNKGETIRNKLFKHLRDFDIGVNIHYIPVYHQPFYNKLGITLENAEKYYNQTITLPMFPTITEKELVNVIKQLKLFLDKNY